MAVRITGILPGSPASKLDIPEGSWLVSVNGEGIEDVLDYGFYTATEEMDLVVRLEDGSERSFHVHKNEYEELGIESAYSAS